MLAIRLLVARMWNDGEQTMMRVRWLSAFATLLIAVSVLVGWAFGIAPLKTVLPGLTTMKANTAVGLLSASLAILLIAPGRDGACRHRVAGAAGLFTALIGVAVLFEYVTGLGLGIDQALVADPATTSMPYPGRLSPGTAVAFVAIGLGIACLALASKRRMLLLGHALATVPASIGYLSLVGYVYGVEGLYNFGPYVAIALHTAVGLSLLAIAMLTVRLDAGWAYAYRGRPIATNVLVRMISLSIVVPFATGLLIVLGARYDLYQSIYGPALFALLSAVAAIWFALRASMMVRRAESMMLEARAQTEWQTQAVIASEKQFRTFAQAMPNHVWSSASDGHLDWFNEQVYKYSGASPDMLHGTAWSELVHPGDIETASRAWSEALASGSAYRTEFRIRGADGIYRWFLVRGEPIRDDTGAIVRWIGTNTDVDEQKRLEAELTRFNDALEQQVVLRTAALERTWRLSLDLLVILDRQGLLVSVNHAWTSALGWDRQDLVGVLIWDFVHPDDRARTTEVFGTVLDEPLVEPYDYRLRQKDGAYQWFAWTGAFEAGFIYANGRPISAVRDAAARQQVLEEALRQSQKMEAVGQLTGGIAHDFNNLLAGITGSLDLMSMRLTQGRVSELDRYIDAAQGAAKRAAALTHRLLAFSRRQTLDPTPTDANRLVAGMEELIRRTVGPAITVEIVEAGGLWTILVDFNQLENALLNLCINARDAMPDGGRITIEAANRCLDERAAREHDVPSGQYVALSVSDTGTGIAPELVERIFDPFFTTKPLGQGTGLGLSMIYGFVRQSGGQVRVSTEVGRGTTMCLYLPRHQGDAATGDRPISRAASERPSHEATVLVVDDEPTVRMLVTEVLEDLGYTVMEAADGVGGLRILASNVPVDLLVTDVGLPGGMNGRQVADAGRAVRPGLKVLFITGYAENAVVGNGHLDPGMRVMTKPFAMEALSDLVKEMIEPA